MSNYVPPDQYPAGQQYPHQPQPQPKKSSSWIIWTLVGCGGLVILTSIAIVAGGYFIWGKAKQAGFDPELVQRNPALAAAKMIVAANPAIEMVSADEARGTITIREKSTGKTLTVNFEDLEDGKLIFSDGEGESVTIDASRAGDTGSLEVKSSEGVMRFGEGAITSMPDWIPTYPGSTPTGQFSMQGDKSNTGTFTFSTSDSTDRVISFFESELERRGLKVNARTITQSGKTSGGVITAEDAGKARSVFVNAIPDGGETKVTVSFEEKKE